MWGLILLRILFIVIFTGMGYSIGVSNPLASTVIGFSLGIVIVLFEVFARRVSLRGLSSAVFGVLLGLFLAWMFGETLNQLPFSKDIPIDVFINIKLFVSFVFIYLGITLGIKG